MLLLKPMNPAVLKSEKLLIKKSSSLEQPCPSEKLLVKTPLRTPETPFFVVTAKDKPLPPEKFLKIQPPHIEIEISPEESSLENVFFLIILAGICIVHTIYIVSLFSVVMSH